MGQGSTLNNWVEEKIRKKRKMKSGKIGSVLKIK